jgi:hypothetical protein
VKGNLVSIMKKWWMIAAVFALALSLTSCSRRGSGSFANYGLSFCDGTMGQIDVYTILVPGQPGNNKIVIIPASLSAPGDIVTITVASQSTKLYKTLLSEVALEVDQQVVAGYLTDAELQQYDEIAITSYTPGVDFLSSNPAKDSICSLPLLGDGNSTLSGNY